MCVHNVPRPPSCAGPFVDMTAAERSTVSSQTTNPDFRGLDSNMFLTVRGGISRCLVTFQES